MRIVDIQIQIDLKDLIYMYIDTLLQYQVIWEEQSGDTYREYIYSNMIFVIFEGLDWMGKWNLMNNWYSK